jgi:hypothetical protein
MFIPTAEENDWRKYPGKESERRLDAKMHREKKALLHSDMKFCHSKTRSFVIC